jgi:multicomponent Na+:H+ antiporter subunit E
MKRLVKQLARWLIPFGLLCLIWGVLTRWDATSWLVGLPASVLALGVFDHIGPRQTWRIQLSHLPGFAVWFLWYSLHGGLDVARRALQPRMPLNPGFVRYSLTLEPGTPRVFLVNCLSLLPGTLSAHLEGNDLVLHALDIETDILAETRRAELWVKKLYGISIGYSHG